MKKTLITLCLILFTLLANSQTTITPIRYWTFNGSNPTTDSTSNGTLNLTAYGGQYTVQNGPIGKSITLTETGNLISGGSFSLNTGIVIEFLFKPGPRFNTKQTNFITDGNGSYSIGFEYPLIRFSTSHKNSSGITVNDDFIITLDGIGRKSYGYYTDGNWHHMVFKFIPSTGVKEIWVDGQLPQGFSKTLAVGTFNNTTSNFFLSHTLSYARYYGSLDEIAIYNTNVPSSLIYKHYLNFQQNQPYSYTNDYTGTIPTASPVTGPLNINEFAPGHVLGQLTSGISSGVSTLPTDQINKFPTPRYKPNHTMMRNVNWMDPFYLGGQFQSWSPTTTTIGNYGSQISLELGKNYNYYLPIYWGANINDPRDTALIGVANRNPNIPLQLVTFRAQIPSQLINQNKPADQYLQNASGQFLNANNQVVTTGKIWRPTSSPSNYSSDGTNVYNRLNTIATKLNRQISLVSDNGEIFPHITDAALANDPVVNANRISLGLNGRQYLSRKMAENDNQAYRDIIMNHPLTLGGKYAYYPITEDPAGYYNWSEARKLNTPINGQYYSTSDFYPRWPNNWRYWVAAWHGWQWFVESRHTELQLGDKFFSPFVSAGWDPNEENNIRPAQWLGLLKVMGNFGAEFFYTGFFSLNSPFPDSRNWVWQASTPSYAQATFSRVETLYKNSNILPGDVPASWVSTSSNPGYAFNGGDVRKLVNVRKHNTQNIYIIAGTIQPHSNIQGNAELESTATINLDGQQLSFKIRRQGSVYVYDKTVIPAIFYQLDNWHESTHPWYWSKSFEFEAELFDNNITPIFRTENTGTNYINYTTGINTTSTLEYNFTTREQNTYYLWVRAKSLDGTIGSININLNTQPIKTIGCISDTNWVWYAYEVCTSNKIQYPNVTVGNHTLKVTLNNNKIFIDKIILSIDPNFTPTPQSNTCGGGIATITTSGSTTFCDGGSVTLTANSGSSYLWNTGATTQSISVSQSGTYIVTVSNGNCSAISQPEYITNVAIVPATITTSGSTTFCQGQSVTLTANDGDMYVWSTGEMTKSITVTNSGSYYVTVYNNGCNSTSSIINVAVNSCPTCVAPTTLTNVNIGSTSVVVSWSPVTQAINGYTIKLKNMKTGIVVLYQIPAGVTTTTLITNPSTKYRWWIRSKCLNTTSSYSSFRAFTTKSSSLKTTLVGVSLTQEELQSMQFEINNPKNTNNSFELIPNPAENEVNVIYRSQSNLISSIEIFDYTGKEIKKYSQYSDKGVNIFNIDLKDMSKGVYIVKLSNNNIYYKQLIIK